MDDSKTYLETVAAEFPGPIARAVEKCLNPSNENRAHEFIRIAFEIAMSFVASVELASYLKSSRKEKGSIDPINKAIQDTGMEMTLGKWASVLQTLSKNLGDKLYFKELAAVYKSNNEYLNAVKFLIEERNSDAHGAPIPEDKYKEVITRRINALITVFKGFDFLRKHEFLSPTGVKLVDGAAEYSLTYFRGVQSNMFSGKVTAGSDQDTILIDGAYTHPSGKPENMMCVHPYLAAFKEAGSDKIGIGVFSRPSGGQMGMRYIDSERFWDVSDSTIDGYSSRPELVREFRSHLELLGMVEKRRPRIAVSCDIKKNIFDLKKGKTDDIELVLKATNMGELYAENVKVRIPLPSGVKESSTGLQEVLWEIDSLSCDKKSIPQTFRIFSESTGQIILPDGFVSYSYAPDDSGGDSDEQPTETEATTIEIEETVYSGLSFLVKDPLSKDPLRPLMTTSMTVEPNPVRLGQPVIVSFRLKNVGSSKAHDVHFRVVSPDALKNKTGSESFSGEIKSGECEDIKIVYDAVRHGVMELICTDITYSDGQGNHYVCDDPGRMPLFIKHSDEEEIRLNLRNIWMDMSLDAEERELFDEMRKTAVSKGIFTDATLDTVVRNIKIENLQGIVEAVGKRKGFTVVPKPLKNALCFEISEKQLPFAVIDTTNPLNIFLWLGCSFPKGQLDKSPYIEMKLNPFGFRQIPLNTCININMLAEVKEPKRSAADILDGWIEKSIDCMTIDLLPIKNALTKVISSAWQNIPSPVVQYDVKGFEVSNTWSQQLMDRTGLRCLYAVSDFKDPSKLHLLSYPGKMSGLKNYMRDWWRLQPDDFLHSDYPNPHGSDIGGYKIEPAAQGGFFIVEKDIQPDSQPSYIERFIAKSINQIQLFKAFSWMDGCGLAAGASVDISAAKRILKEMLDEDPGIILYTDPKWGLYVYADLRSFSNAVEEAAHIGTEGKLKKAFFRITDPMSIPEPMKQDMDLHDYHYLSRYWTKQKEIASLDDFTWIKEYALVASRTIRNKRVASWTRGALEILLNKTLGGHRTYLLMMRSFSLQEDDAFISLLEVESGLKAQYPDIYPEKKGTKGERRYISRACNQPMREQLLEYDYSDWPNIKIRINPEYRESVKDTLADVQ
ncbi:MAG: hypothetical protein BWY28_02341 [bacterium ADurb.Bin236]|nr:MAG: hypothetical protein BWY28_02341 [bacterium ADurb.Bin236]